MRKIEIEQAAAKERYDKSRVKNVNYTVGDIVFMKTNPIATGESTKLQSRFKGPLLVTQSLPSDTYRVQNLNSKESSKTDTTAHVSQLKLWRGHDDESDDEPELEIDSLIDTTDRPFDPATLRSTTEYDDVPSSSRSDKLQEDASMLARENNQDSGSQCESSDNNSLEVASRRKGERRRQRPKRFDDFDMS